MRESLRPLTLLQGILLATLLGCGQVEGGIDQPCYDDGTCDAGLVCKNGVCVEPGGALGEPCYPDQTCDDDLDCKEGVCVAPAGELGEPCYPDGTCDGALVCDEGVCVEPAGGLGEPCYVDDTCDDYLECEDGVCVEGPPPIEGSTFSFWCSAQNVRRPSAEIGPIAIPCSVTARDVDGNDVPVGDERFDFMAETGRLEVNEEGQLQWVLSPGETPKTVEPLGDAATGEPRWYDESAGVTRNPRDGIATLVVHAHGRPTGQVDLLQGEPFVDENDDGEWNPGEPFYDANDNGQYDGPTGATEDRRIWRWTKIMVTGPVDHRAPESSETVTLWDAGEHDPLNIEIDRRSAVPVGLLLVDENLNPIASHPLTGPDRVGVEGTPADVVTPAEHNLAFDTMGLAFAQPTGEVIAGSSRSGYLQGPLTYYFTVTNPRPTADEGDPVFWSIDSVEVRRAPHPGADQITESLDGPKPQGYLR